MSGACTGYPNISGLFCTDRFSMNLKSILFARANGNFLQILMTNILIFEKWKASALPVFVKMTESLFLLGQRLNSILRY